MKKEKISIILKSFDIAKIQKSIDEIIKVVKPSHADVCGPIPLPSSIKKYTLIRGPHIYKRGMEQFEIKTHRRLIIITPTAQTIECLKQLNLSSGVYIKIKTSENN